MTFWQQGPYGPPAADLVGYGYYVTGHEMMHYVLENNGIPIPTHHCLYVTPDAAGNTLMGSLTDFLIERGYASFPVRRYGYDQEVALKPCARLP
jgi:hypothetical protein